MPLHDWTRAGPWLFRDFHFTWMVYLSQSLNRSILPAGAYSLTERVFDPRADGESGRRGLRVVVCSADDAPVAAIELGWPLREAEHGFIYLPDPRSRLREGLNLLLIDVFPDAGGRRIFASYEADSAAQPFAAHCAVGEELPAVPLRISPGHRVMIPLEQSYRLATDDIPACWRGVFGIFHPSVVHDGDS